MTAVELESVIEKVLRKLEPPDYLTVSEMARKAKLDPDTIKKFCYEGELKYTLFGPKSIRVKVRDWIKFCQKLEEGRK